MEAEPDGESEIDGLPLQEALFDSDLLADFDALRLAETERDGEREPEGEADVDADATSVDGTNAQVAEDVVPTLTYIFLPVAVR